MNELQQFLGLLNSMDLGEETKTKLVSSFENVSTSVNGLVNDLKQNLALERDKTKPLKDTIKAYKEKLGLSESSTIEDLDTFIANLNKKNGDTVDKSKYENDLQELRNLLQEKEKLANDNMAKYDDLRFGVNILDKGLLKDFTIENPLVKNALINELKPRVGFDNDKIFLKDESGNPLKDITTGEFLPVEKYVDTLKSNPIYKDFLRNPIKGNGAGVQDSKQTTTTQAKEVNPKDYKSTADFVSAGFNNLNN